MNSLQQNKYDKKQVQIYVQVVQCKVYSVQWYNTSLCTSSKM